MRLTRRRLLSFALCAALTPAAAAAQSGTQGDAADPAGGRVAIAGGDLTEIAFALGAGDRVVGVDSTSTYPPEATELPQMGYMRRLSAEGVLGLAPDRLIASAEAGPAAALDALRAAGLTVETAPEGTDLDSVPAKIRFMGRALGREDAAEALAGTYAADMEALRAEVAEMGPGPRTLFLLTAARGAPMAAGAGTSADAVLAAAGAVNALEGVTGWKPVSPEALIAADPEVVVMMDGHAERAGGAEAILDLPGLAATPAAQAGRFVTVDGVRLLGLGPRTPAAVADLARALRGAPSTERDP